MWGWPSHSLSGIQIRWWDCFGAACCFKELRGSRTRDWVQVLGGAAAIVFGAAVLAVATAEQSGDSGHRAVIGIVAALGAGVLFGTMYIPYRKAYISGMNPLSLVTIFTFGEIITITVLGLVFYGGVGNLAAELHRARPMLFWPFVGGFCWVIGDLFQQYAAKYIGIGRGIPLSNTNQLWGLAWGALVFAEFDGLSPWGRTLIVAGSAIMIAGAISISTAAPSATELENWDAAMHRECDRYGLDKAAVAAVVRGDDPHADLNAPAPLVGAVDHACGLRRVCVAGPGHPRSAHRGEPAVDDRTDDPDVRPAGCSGKDVAPADEIFIENSGQ